MFEVRPATGEDIAAVDALLARAYPRLLKPDYPPSVLVLALPKIARAQPYLMTSGTYFVVEQDNQILGAGGWTAQAPGAGAVTRGVGHIRHLVTDDRVTRRGVATALMTHILTDASQQGLRRMSCVSTLTAEPFYKTIGFQRIKPVTVPLGPGIDFPAIEMQRTL